MVTARPRGASTTGCLVSLLIFVAVLYYGVNIGEVYFRYYRLLDEMKTQSRLAAALDNGTIQRRIQAAILDIGVPEEAAAGLTITRRPRRGRSPLRPPTASRSTCRCSIIPSDSTPKPRRRSEHRALRAHAPLPVGVTMDEGLPGA
jgi:hypothetical protein